MNPIKSLSKVIKTKRLEMRQLEPTVENAQMIYNVLKNENPDDYYFNPISHDGKILPESVSEMMQIMEKESGWIKNSGIIYYIFLKDKLIGYRRFFYTPENRTLRGSNTWFIKSERQKGYGRETFEAIEQIAFDKINANRCTRDCSTENQLSIKAFKAAGYRLDGISRQDFTHHDGTLYDNMMWSKLKSEREL